MSAGVGVTVSANTGQAVRSISGFAKEIEKLAGMMGKFTGMSKGTGGHGSVGQMSKEMEAYGRAAKRANDGLKALLATQAKIQQQKIGATGDALKDLQRQERYTNRRVSQASVRAGAADLRFESARAAGANGSGPAEDDHGHAGGHIPHPVAGFAEGLTNELGGILPRIAGAAKNPAAWAAVAAVIAGEILGSGIKEAIGESIKLADFLPRVGGEGAEQGFRLLRHGAAAYGYNPEEAMGAAGNVSLGGGTLRNGLTRDTLATMALSRMFGLDVGGESALMGTAGRQGAFHPGDARKFAEMLANAIYKTGMDPRALEIQEGTLTLMNRQMATMPSANPAAALAMQTLFNKTGIPAFQGQAGVGLLSQMQAAMTGPMDDEHEAFFQMAVRKAGLGTSLEDMFRLHGKGPLGEPRLFSAYAALANENVTPFSRRAAFSDNAKIPYNDVVALDEKYGLGNIGRGKYLKAAMASLKGGDVLHEGALKARELAGNQFRNLSANIANAKIDIGSAFIGPALGLAKQVNKTVQQFMGIEDSKLAPEQKAGAYAGAAASAAGMDPKTAKKLGQFVTGGIYAAEHGVDWAGAQLQQGDTSYSAPSLAPGAQWDPQHMRWNIPSRAKGGKAPGLPPVDGAAIGAARRLDIHIHDHSPASQHAHKQLIKKAIQEHHDDVVSYGPNQRYTRP